MPHTPLKLRVLVVEDDPDTALSFATLLELWGYLAGVATEPAKALRLAEQARPDVIFLDIGLPDMDGYQLAAKIRQRWPGKPPYVIAITGYGMADDRRQSREAGIDLHLVKPVDPDQLKCILGQCDKAAGVRPRTDSA